MLGRSIISSLAFVAAAGDAECDAGHCVDDVALLQSRLHSNNLNVAQHVKCGSWSDQTCSGNQCCLGKDNGLTFPCPNADKEFDGCQSVQCAKWSNQTCSGNQCCLGKVKKNGKVKPTFPCPNADADWDKCETGVAAFVQEEPAVQDSEQGTGCCYEDGCTSCNPTGHFCDSQDTCTDECKGTWCGESQEPNETTVPAEEQGTGCCYEDGCTSCNPTGHFCDSQDKCTDECKGTWCGEIPEANETTVPATEQGTGCCYEDGCTSCNPTGHFCDSQDKCTDECKGTWCGAE